MLLVHEKFIYPSEMTYQCSNDILYLKWYVGATVWERDKKTWQPMCLLRDPDKKKNVRNWYTYDIA